MDTNTHNFYHMNFLKSITLKRWPDGLASQRKFSTFVFFGHLLAWLHRLALTMTLVELQFARKSTQVFHRLATQHKSTQFDRMSTVYARLVTPFGHPSQVRTQVLVLQTCVDSRVRASSLGTIPSIPILV